MNDPTKSTIEAKPRSIGFGSSNLEAWQWLFALFVAAIISPLLSDQSKLSAPGAPIILFWATIGVGGLIVLAHSPPSFTRLPPYGRLGAYIAAFLYFLFLSFTVSQVEAAWEKTPRGAAEARKAEAERKASDAEWARSQQVEAEADARSQRDGAALREVEKLGEQVQEQADKLEACFTSFGHRLPALETPVKDSLHNPHVFEHVETIAIVPDSDRNNVAMTFRAENNFGALRTYVIKASVLPESCEVAATGEPELM